MPMPKAKIDELHAFIQMLEKNPEMLHTPELSFLKTFMVKYGATIPQEPNKPASGSKADATPETAETAEEGASSSSEDEAPPVYPEKPIIEQEAGQMEVEPDELPTPPKHIDSDVELTDEQIEQVAQLKQEAADAVQDGKLEEALTKYSSVMEIASPSALLCVRRAEVLLKLRRPVAAIADCDVAVKLNPDNGKAYKTRGKAHRLLGNWVEARRDLDLGQNIDYDDDTYEVQIVVSERAHKLEEYERAVQRIDDDMARKKKIRELKRRRKQAQKEYEREKKEEEFAGGMPGGMGGMPGGMGGMPGGMGGMPGGMGGMPGGMGGMPGGMGGMGGMPGGMGGMPGGGDLGGLGSMFGGLMSDPELKKILENPKTMTAIQEIMSNPTNLSKYKDDPEIMGAFQKLTSKFGGGGMAA